MTKPAKPLVHWLERMPRTHLGLDYGCGKLRYSKILARRCTSVTIVDSEVQLSRLQKLGKATATIRQFVGRNLRNCRVLSIEEFSCDQCSYDFVLCANVLSAIPDRRARSYALRRIASALKSTGLCLFVAQYRNSYFKQVAADGATPHLDGWILRKKSGAYYFGILGLRKLTQLVLRHGFSVKRGWTVGQSAYLLASRKV